MEDMNTMFNEEVTETVETVAKKGIGNGVEIAAGVVVLVVIGGVVYRYVVKPTVEKIKAKRIARRQAEENDSETEIVDVEEVTDME